ncbi:S-arrestin-like isoform X2 [Hippocampus comes]|uniref:S-arrestin-like isoform X2 n=1 Tax=Hippocampus comes TaxID=109280 RepID=UPI00094E2D02|nr:PREDICTED: S-arrestin-like isoform X2 [Hippocampus comes]
MSPKQVVFKKASPDKSVTIYMASRDLVDRGDGADPLDGVLVVDSSQLAGKRGQLTHVGKAIETVAALGPLLGGGRAETSQGCSEHSAFPRPSQRPSRWKSSPCFRRRRAERRLEGFRSYLEAGLPSSCARTGPTLRFVLSVYVMLSCTFVYGRRDEDVMGAAFRRDLFVATRQVFPELQDKERLTRSKIQEKLLRKLGRDAFPFFLELPDNLPNSVTLQPGPSDVGKKCAVEFQVKAFRADDRRDEPDGRSSVSLTVRKVQFGPRDVEPSPFAETTFDFLMSDKPLRVKLSLPKETFGHGEPLRAEVRIANWSNRRVKDISLSVEQVTNVVLYSNDKYVKSVAKEETSDGVAAGSSLAKSYTLYPRLEHNKERRGLALDGHLKHQDTNLASSSMVKREVAKELQGILVSYKLLLKMTATGPLGSSEVRVELPFRLMHPKPEAEGG